MRISWTASSLYTGNRLSARIALSRPPLIERSGMIGSVRMLYFKVQRLSLRCYHDRVWEPIYVYDKLCEYQKINRKTLSTVSPPAAAIDTKITGKMTRKSQMIIP